MNTNEHHFLGESAGHSKMFWMPFVIALDRWVKLGSKLQVPVILEVGANDKPSAGELRTCTGMRREPSVNQLE